VNADRLAIEYLSVFGLPPVEFVQLAAELGVGYISTGLTAMPLESLGYPAFSLRDDAGLRRELRSALDDIIIRGGENISAMEVEEVLQTLPGVAEAVAVAAPDDRFGERTQQCCG
jgi:acyl-CoA synthetase (AMP-forming)/AMP-acid ligase II